MIPATLIWVAILAAAALIAWSLKRLWRIAAVGSAYKAKVLCSLIFGSGRAIDPSRTEEVSADSYRLLRLFGVHVDKRLPLITVSLAGLRARSAFYRPGLGATLLPPESAQRGRSADLQVRPAANLKVRTPTIPNARWPVGVESPALKTVVDSAFTEPDPKKLRRTRAIVVVQDNRIVAEQYAPGFSETTRFSGWSVAKGVINALIGVLVGEGRLSLQDTALLPQWQPPDPRSNITLEDLLRMRSGLRFSEVYDDFNSDVVEMLFNRPDTAAYAASLPLISQPGTTWSYASGTSNILSAIARRVVGDDEYFDWPRRVLFEPLGMTSAILEPDASGTFVGSSFMLATARDWARFGQLYLHDGVWDGRRILPEGWVRFSTSSTPQSDGNFGAHWWLKLQPELGGITDAARRIPADAYFAVGHEIQVLTVIPSRRLVVVRLGLSIHVDAWNHAGFLADLLDAV